MSKHTPGPWRVAEAYGPDNDDGSPNLCFHEIRGSNGEYIGSTWAAPHVANARLIAAAPKMLEALKGLVKEMGDESVLGTLATVRLHLAQDAIKLAEEGE